MRKVLGSISLLVLLLNTLLTPLTYAGEYEEILEISGENTAEEVIVEENGEEESSSEFSVEEENGEDIFDEENEEEEDEEDAEVHSGAVSEQGTGDMGEISDDESLTGGIVEGETGSVVDSIGTGDTIEVGSGEIEGLTGEIVESGTGSLVEGSTGAVSESTGGSTSEEGTGEVIKYNETPITGERTYDDVTVKVEALTGIFPEGTELVIEPIKWWNLWSLKDQLVEGKQEVKEDTTVVAFDITFIYSGEEVQPKEGEKVKVTFDYSSNKELTDVDEKEEQEVKVYHIEDKDSEGNELEKEEQKIVDVTNKEESKEEGIAVADGESFSIYVLTIVENNPNTIALDGKGGELNSSTNITDIVCNDQTGLCTGNVAPEGGNVRFPSASRANAYFLGWIGSGASAGLSTLTKNPVLPVATVVGQTYKAKYTCDYGYVDIDDECIPLADAPANGIVYDSESQTITVWGDVDGTKMRYTIQDRNVGATETGAYNVYTDAARGKYFQYGNNNGLYRNQTHTFLDNSVNVGNIVPSIYSGSLVKIDKFPYVTTNGTGYLNIWGYYSKINDWEARRGPCPVGYHVPSDVEFKNILKTLGSTTWQNALSQLWLPGVGWGYNNGTKLGTQKDCENENKCQGKYHQLKIDKPSTRYYVAFESGRIGSVTSSDANRYFPVRCFQDYADCSSNQHTEGFNCVDNTKQTTCLTGEIDNGEYTEEIVTANWSSTGWIIPLCSNFTCNLGYHKNEAGTGCDSNTKILSCDDVEHGTLDDEEIVYTWDFETESWTGEICEFTCNDDFHKEGTGCVSNTKTQSCDEIEHGITEPGAQMNLIWDFETESWTGDMCEFTCEPSYHKNEQGVGCEFDEKEVECAEGDLQHGHYIKENVIATWNGISWNIPICENFTCITDYHQEGTGCEYKEKETKCSSGDLTNGVYIKNNVTATWNGTSWDIPVCTDFLCNDNYHKEGTGCSFNQREMTCLTGEIDNGAYIESGVIATWNGEGWDIPACTTFSCNDGYHINEEGTGCEYNIKEVYCTGYDDMIDHGYYYKTKVLINYVGDHWEDPVHCPLECSDLYYDNNGSCEFVEEGDSGIKYNPDFGTITVWGGGKKFTIMDKNVGATTTGYGSEYPITARGAYFQWGNNYPFSGNYCPSVTNTKVELTDDTPGSYNVGVFVKQGGDWFTDRTKGFKLWGGWVSRGTDYYYSLDNQGPCPDGFHVPSVDEYQGLMTAWQNYHNKEENDNGELFAKELYFPYQGKMVGNNNLTCSISNGGTYSATWTVNYTNSAAGRASDFFIDNSTIKNYDWDHGYLNNGIPVRCFQNYKTTCPKGQHEDNGNCVVKVSYSTKNRSGYIVGSNLEYEMELITAGTVIDLVGPGAKKAVSEKGYPFKGWETGGGFGVINSSSYTLESDRSFYAVFEKSLGKVNVTMYGNGAKLSTSSDSYGFSCNLYARNAVNEEDATCSIYFPAIVRESYNILGYSKDRNKKDTEGLIPQKKYVYLHEGGTYYAITNTGLNILFSGNENKLLSGDLEVDEMTGSCVKWNNDSGCNLNSPRIIPVEGKEPLGFSLTQSEVGSNIKEHNSEILVTDSTTYYAWSHSNPSPLSVYYEYGTGVVGQTITSGSCTPEDRYNLQENATGCVLSLLPLTTKVGYKAPLWYKGEYGYSGNVNVYRESEEGGHIKNGDILTGVAYPKGDIEYHVKHYFQLLNENLTGATNRYQLSGALTYTGYGTGHEILRLSDLKDEIYGFTYITGSIAGEIGNEVDLAGVITKETAEINPDGSLDIKLFYKRDTYTVKWINEGVVIQTGNNLPYGVLINKFSPANPTKTATMQTGYIFAGWYDESNNLLVNDTILTKGTEYIANYSEALNKYTVLWKNSTGTILETDENVEYGTKPKYDGNTPISGATAEYQYWFSGWTPTITSETIIEGDTVYTATYEQIKRKYEITWKDYNDQVIDTTEVEYGVIPTHANPTRTGHEFNTWDPIPVEVTGSTSYKATYTIKQYTVTPEKGVGVADILGGGNYDYGTEIVLTGIAKEGYHFEGGESVKEFNILVPAENITVILTAQPNTYYVHFKNNGGEGVMNDQAFIYDQEQALTPNTYTRNGYTFVSWTDGEGGIFKDKAVVKNLVTSGIINLIAQWIEGDVPGPTPPIPEPSGGGSSGGGRIIDKNTDDKEHDSAEDKQQEKDVKDDQTKKDLIIQTGGDIKQITGDTSVIVPEPVYKWTEEELTAYKYAYKYGITTLAPEYAAMPDDYVQRGHMAKMVVNYALNVLHRKLPEKLPRECRWLDGRNAWESKEIKDYAEKACALGIMGIDMKYFQPKKYVTRAQFGTIIGRLMWGKLTSKPYYAGHLARLKERGIMTQIENPENRIEIRKWAWLMFMRMEKYIM